MLKKLTTEDMDAMRRLIRDQMGERFQRDEIREAVEAGNARAPIRAEIEEVLQAWEKQISEQRKLIDQVRQAMTMEE